MSSPVLQSYEPRLELIRAIVRLRSLSPGMLMNRMTEPALDALPGGVREGEKFILDENAPLHRSESLDQMLPAEQRVGKHLLELFANAEPGSEIELSPEDAEALHIGERISEAKMHRMDGMIGLPGDLVMAALVRAGSYVKYGKRMMTNRFSSVVPGLVRIGFEFAPLYVDGGEPGVVPWKPFTIPGLAPREKGRRARREISITRPRIKHWQCEFTIEFDRKRIHPANVRKLFEIAGREIGFGDFRPGLESARTTRGRFGRFMVERFDLLD